MSLNLYTTLVKRNESNKIEDISLFRSDFSYSAFFFSIFWFFSHAMWRESITFIILELALLKLEKVGFIGSSEVFLIQVGLSIYIGMNAKNLYSRHLQKNLGYNKLGYVLAKNEEEARLRSMKNWHRNSPDLSFDEIGRKIIDPDYCLKSAKLGKYFKKFLKRC